MNSAASGSRLPPVLKTAAMWGHYVLASKQLVQGESLLFGEDTESLVAAPEGCAVVEVPIRSVGNGWELDPTGVTGGVLFLRGRAEDARAVGERGAPLPIVPGDHGVMQYGSFSVFFQFSETVAPPRWRLRLDGALVLSWLFAVVTVCGGLLLLSLVYPDLPLPQPVELSSPEQLKQRFRVYAPLPSSDSSPSSPAEPRAAKSEDAPDGATKARKPVQARRRPRPRPRPRRPSGSAAPGTNQKGLSAVTDALEGSAGREVLKTLGTIGSVADALGGLSAAKLVTRGGKASPGLRGGGSNSTERGVQVAGAGQLKTGLSGKARRSRRGKAPREGASARGSGVAKLGGERAVSKGEKPVAGQGLSPAQVARVVKRRTTAFQACYETALARSPNLSGGVTVEFTVIPTGKVQAARVASSTLRNKRVEGCVLRMFRRLRFPRADQATSVSWPFVFKGKG